MFIGELWDCMATAWSRTGQSSTGGSLGGVLGKGTFWFGRVLDLMYVAWSTATTRKLSNEMQLLYCRGYMQGNGQLPAADDVTFK